LPNERALPDPADLGQAMGQMALIRACTEMVRENVRNFVDNSCNNVKLWCLLVLYKMSLSLLNS